MSDAGLRALILGVAWCVALWCAIATTLYLTGALR